MTLRVVGAGLPRTGTASLKLALEQLLGGPCYHMFEVLAHPAHIALWHQAALDQPPDWDDLFGGYMAAVDFPASAFWPDLAAANPGALIVLSVRDSAQQWWDSASQTVFSPSLTTPPPGTPMAEFTNMINAIKERLGMSDVTDKDAMIAAYERHNLAVRTLASAGRLIEWRPGDGWQPIAGALGLPVPDLAFPKVNTRAEFHARFIADGGPEPGEVVHLAPQPAALGGAAPSGPGPGPAA